ncbi:MAG: hypothetical protein JHC40_18195 [Burkholderiales bacterium]|jgi:uncharacterized protein YutE (UPF0331/DUF86 family)|nr:hypothetical protein [Burkholderiales bacterium]
MKPGPRGAGFGNVLVHGNLGIDSQVVGSFVEQGLPGLAAALERMAMRCA